jgi:hypothetical protein
MGRPRKIKHPIRPEEALLLFRINLICVNLAGVITFLAQGIRARVWWEEERELCASSSANCWSWQIAG